MRGKRLPAIRDRRLALATAGILLTTLLAPTPVSLTILLVIALVGMACGAPYWALFATAASGTHATSLLIGVPFVALLAGALLAGVAIYFAASHPLSRSANPFRASLPLLSSALFCFAYFVFAPAATVSGTLAGIALATVPLFTLLLTGFSSSSPIPPVVWLAYGFVAATTPGLIDAYSAVLGNYSGYTSIRVFESAIGSSNFAAVICATTGVTALAAKPKSALWRWSVAMPFLLAPFLFASRGAIIALAISLALFTLGSAKERQSSPLKPLLAVGATIGLALLALSQQWFWVERFTANTVDLYSLTSGRDKVWSTTIEIISSSPFLGSGPGGLTDGLLATLDIAYAHNLVLTWLGQIGILGTILLVWALWPTPVRLRGLSILPFIAAMTASLLEPLGETPVGAMMLAGTLAAHKLTSYERNNEDQSLPRTSLRKKPTRTHARQP